MQLKKKEVLVLNTETNRELPFEWRDHFAVIDIHNLKDLKDAVEWLITKPSIKIVVIDSFTRFLAKERERAKVINIGFDVFSAVNSQVYTLVDSLLPKIKASGKAVILLSQEKINDLGNREITMTGKELGAIEGFFDFVLFTQTDETGEQYLLQTKKRGNTPSKTPPGMFDDKEILIPNDLSKVYDRMIWFLGMGKDNIDFGKLYNILIIGGTGTGKTSSIRNLVEHDDVVRDLSNRPVIIKTEETEDKEESVWKS